jgi:phenylpropionate dioxygenase-like ring-hydroxylating dioxygenase large terminal subunit
MEKSMGFDKGEHGLVPVRLSTWAGFMFVCFAEQTESLGDWLGSLVDKFAPYRLERYRCVRRVAYDLDCNWKLYIENAMEDYHTPTVHRSSIGLQETTPLDTIGQWDSIHMEADDTIAVLPEDSTPFPHADGLTGRPAGSTFFTAVYPTTFFGSTQDCMWWLQTLPDGPRRCRVIHGACFPESTVARPDFGDHVWKYYKRWNRSIPEDNDISERQQAGLESAFSAPGRLSVHEPVVHSMANWVLDRVLDGRR